MRRAVAYSALAVAAVAALIVVGCRQADQGASEPAGAAGANLPAGLFLAEQPGNAVPLAEVIRDAEHGQQVVVSGVIGRGKQPFMADRAAVNLVDPNVPSCADKPADHCPTPWDYCCEPPAEMAKNLALVQVVGGDGRTLPGTLRGAGGMEPLSRVVVVGTVQRSPDGKAVSIVATGIYVQK